MTAGIIDHETGTRDMRRINGLYRFMPRTALLAMVATAAMAGAAAQRLSLQARCFSPKPSIWAALARWPCCCRPRPPWPASSRWPTRPASSTTCFFNGEPVNPPRYPPHDAPRLMRLPLVILVAHCLIVGIFPGLTVALPQNRRRKRARLSLPALTAVWHRGSTCRWP